MNLPTATAEKIKGLCGEGDSLTASGNHLDALKLYTTALSQLPDQKSPDGLIVWILVAIAESNFFLQKYTEANETFLKVYQKQKGANPLIHLRLGQSFFKIGRLQDAEFHLKKSGTDKTIQDLQDPVYWELIEGLTIRDTSSAPV